MPEYSVNDVDIIVNHTVEEDISQIIVGVDRTIIEAIVTLKEINFAIVEPNVDDVNFDYIRRINELNIDNTRNKAVDLINSVLNFNQVARYAQRLAYEKLQNFKNDVKDTIIAGGTKALRALDAANGLGVEDAIKKKYLAFDSKFLSSKLGRRGGIDQGVGAKEPSSTNAYFWGANDPNVYENKELRRKPGKVNAMDLIMTKLPVPFYFVDIRSDNHCFFNATLSDLNDSFTPSWNKEEYFGRSEGISKYLSTERTISTGFTIIAESRDDLKMIYEKLDWLAKTTYPKYKENNIAFGYEKAPIIRMRIGDVIKYNSTGLAGYLTSLNYSFDLDGGWETETNGQKVLKKVDVTLSFTVIHDFMPD